MNPDSALQGTIFKPTATLLHQLPPSAPPPHPGSPHTAAGPTLLPNRDNDILPFGPPPTATPSPSPQFRARPINSFHAMERSQRDHELALTHCRRVVRKHGAGVSARRFVVFVEPGQGDAGWRDCGV